MYTAIVADLLILRTCIRMKWALNRAINLMNTGSLFQTTIFQIACSRSQVSASCNRSGVPTSNQ